MAAEAYQGFFGDPLSYSQQYQQSESPCYQIDYDLLSLGDQTPVCIVSSHGWTTWRTVYMQLMPNLLTLDSQALNLRKFPTFLQAIPSI